jgi:RNA polymerase sigma factor (sigma-70 family)
MVSAQGVLPGKTLSAAASDAELLARYVQRRDHEAFAEIVRRHSGIVWGVCRRVLPQEQDAEDAFQASFIILAKKASSLREARYLSTWLYSVAYHAARNVRKMKLRRQQHEASGLLATEVADTRASLWSDIEPILDEEMQRLPRKYQLPIVLCCLQGKTQAEAGTLLRWPIGTIAARLSRGREMLRQRLQRRGVVVSSLLLGSFLTEECMAGIVPSLLLERCTHPESLLTSPLKSLVSGWERQSRLIKLACGLGITALALTGGLLYWNSRDTSGTVLISDIDDGRIKPDPRYIALPREPKTVVLTWKKLHRETRDMEQSVTILADGSLTLRWRDNQANKTIEKQLQLNAQEWQELLQFMVHDAHFYQFDGVKQWQDFLKEYNFDGDLKTPSDVWTTSIELHLPQKQHQVEWEQLGATEAWFFEHASIRELVALNRKLSSYILVEQAGGRAAVEPICQQLNEMLRPNYKERAAFTPADLRRYQSATDEQPASYTFAVGSMFHDKHFLQANCQMQAGKPILRTVIPGPSVKPPRMNKRNTESKPPPE